MPDKIKPIDFESTVQLDLSKLNPYSQNSEGDIPVESYGISNAGSDIDELGNPNPSTVEINVSDLSAELDVLAEEFSFPDLEPGILDENKIEPTAHESTVTLSSPPTPEASKSLASQISKPIIPNPVAKTSPQPAAPSIEKITPPPEPIITLEESTPLFDLSDELLDDILPSEAVEKEEENTPPIVEEVKKVKKTTLKVNKANPKVESTVIEKSPATNNGMVAILVGIIGLIAGSAGVWMASNANIQLASLEHQIQLLETDLRTHLRSTATTLAITDSVSENTVETEAPTTKQITPKTITPATPITKAHVKETVKVAVSSGGWSVIISSHQSRKRAEKEQTRLSKMGIQTSIQSSTVKKRVWYRVMSPGFSSKKEAYRHVSELKKNNGVQGAWVSKRKK